MTDKLKFEMHDNTALITIDNPAANTWDSDNLQALEQLITELNANSDCYSLVITGAGKSFFQPAPILKCSLMVTRKMRISSGSISTRPLKR